MGYPPSLHRGSRKFVDSRRPGENFTAARMIASEWRCVERMFAVCPDTQESQ